MVSDVGLDCSELSAQVTGRKRASTARPLSVNQSGVVDPRQTR